MWVSLYLCWLNPYSKFYTKSTLPQRTTTVVPYSCPAASWLMHFSSGKSDSTDILASDDSGNYCFMI